MSFDDSHTCHMKGICTVHIKLSDGTVRELKDVRYVPYLKKNVTSIGALKAKGLRKILGEDVQWLIGCSEGHST